MHEIPAVETAEEYRGRHELMSAVLDNVRDEDMAVLLYVDSRGIVHCNTKDIEDNEFVLDVLRETLASIERRMRANQN